MKIGAEKVYVEDLRREFIEELCFPAVQCNAVYENVYLLGTFLCECMCWAASPVLITVF